MGGNAVIEISSSPVKQEHEPLDSDYDSADDGRSEGELEGIAWEIQQLESQLSYFKTHYKLKDRLGEGTFSSVYKALDLMHDELDNSHWCDWCKAVQQLPTPAPTSSESEKQLNINGKRGSPDSDAYCRDQDDLSSVPWAMDPPKRRKLHKSKVYVALKRIYVTSSPQRIQNELEILAMLRGQPNLANLITAFRHEDQVIAVMPYQKHQDFRDYYRTMTLDEIRTYFVNLFTGLAFTHKHGIVHRDIKPANFLYNFETGQGVLADFGLAERFDPFEWHAKCLHSLPCASIGLPHGTLLDHPKPLIDQVRNHLASASSIQNRAREQGLAYESPWVPITCEDEGDLEARKEEEYEFYENWERAKPPPKKTRVGHLKTEHDKRPSARANRAGTRGFRAPEVLLKCPDQSISLDVWSVGVILLSVLSRRFPFFQSNDDVEALMEIAALFGKKKMESCAALHNRTFVTNVPSVVDPEYTTMHRLIYGLNPRIFKENMPADGDPESLDWYTTASPLYQAIDLLKQTLLLDCTKRISAADALKHPFLAQPANVWGPLDDNADG